MAKINVMISSRSIDEVPTYKGSKDKQSLSEIREMLKQEIENFEVMGGQPFCVWTHENPPKGDGGVDIWKDCIYQAQNCHIFIALYNGHAGSEPENPNAEGICHMELQYALAAGSDRVRIIDLPMTKVRSGKNLLFQNYKANLKAMRYRAVAGSDEILDAVRAAISDVLIKLTLLGVREAKRSNQDSGEALLWADMSFGNRKVAIEAAMKQFYQSKASSESTDLLSFSKKVKIRNYGISDSLGISKAIELTGKPFITEVTSEDSAVGSIYLMGCFKAVTEAQARKYIGDSDITVVKSGFGIYCYDPNYHIQIIFLNNCKDSQSTRFAMERFSDWLRRNEDFRTLVQRRSSYRASLIGTIKRLKKESN